MEKLQVIQRAKSYIEMLSNGIDPISGEAISENTLGQERIKKCFVFISELLDEVIKNNGLVELPENGDSSPYLLVKKKAPFSLTWHQKSNIQISETPILPSVFLKNINNTIEKDSMEKLSITTINKWLIKQGYLSESKVPTVINKRVKALTPLSASIGVIEKSVVDYETGETKAQLLFSKQAQEFILDNIDSILA